MKKKKKRKKKSDNKMSKDEIIRFWCIAIGTAIMIGIVIPYFKGTLSIGSLF